jgi:hypothetical protein
LTNPALLFGLLFHESLLLLRDALVLLARHLVLPSGAQALGSVVSRRAVGECCVCVLC